MALIPILRQPIRMKPFDESDFVRCDVPTEFCSLFKKGDDYLRAQMQQTPCGDNLICNPDFEYGANLVTNGTFTGSATGWTLTGNWVYGANAVSHTSTIGAVTQSIPSLVVGQRYQITFTLSAVTVGGGVFQVKLGGTVSANFTAAGTYTIDIVCGGSGTSVEFIATNGFLCTLDDISVQGVACWITPSGDWTFSNASSCHTPGSTGDLYEDIYSSLAVNDYVVVSYAVFGMSGGTLEVYVGGNLVRTVTENGTYTDYFVTTLADTLLKFTPDTDFDGCLTVESSYRLYNAADLVPGASLIDLDGNIIDSLPIGFFEDRVNLYHTTDNIDEDCYRFRIFDPCRALTNGEEINSDIDFAIPGDWTFDNTHIDGGSSGAITGGQLVLTVGAGYSSGYFLVKNDSYSFPIGVTQYSAKIVLSTGNFDEPIGPNIGPLTILFPGGNLITISEFGPAVLENSSYTINALITVTNQIANSDYNTFTIKMDGIANANDVYRFNSLSIELAEISEADNVFTSNCLSVKEEVDNAQLVRGVSDEAHSLGFVFDPTFFPEVRSRLFLSFTNPHHPDNQNNYLYSSGVKKKTFAQLEKLYDLIFEDVDENMHDTIALVLSSDHVYIGTNEYIWEEKSYDPKWLKKSPTGVCESEVEIGRLSGTVFN